MVTKSAPPIVSDTKTRACRALLGLHWEEREIASALGLPHKRVCQIRDAGTKVVVLSEREAALRLEARVLMKTHGWTDEKIDMATDVRNRGMNGRMTLIRKIRTRDAVILLRTKGWSHQTIADALLLSRQTVSAILNADARREESET